MMSRRNLGDQISGGVGVKLEQDPVGRSLEFAVNNSVLDHIKPSKTQDSREDRTSSNLSSGQSGTSALDHEKSPFDDTSICSTSPVSYAPLCRQFWKANKYDEGVVQKSSLRSTHLSEIINLLQSVPVGLLRFCFLNWFYNFTFCCVIMTI